MKIWDLTNQGRRFLDFFFVTKQRIKDVEAAITVYLDATL